MMTHIGTALVVAIGSLIAYFLYPNIGHLFIVSPIAAIGVTYYLQLIKPRHVDPDASRGLITTSPTMTEYEHMDDEQDAIWIAKNGSKADPDDDADSNAMCAQMDCVGPSHSYIPPDLLKEAGRNPVADDLERSRSGPSYLGGEYMVRDEPVLSASLGPDPSVNTHTEPSSQTNMATSPPVAVPSGHTTDRPPSSSLPPQAPPMEGYHRYEDQEQSGMGAASHAPTSRNSYPSFRFGWSGNDPAPEGAPGGGGGAAAGSGGAAPDGAPGGGGSNGSQPESMYAEPMRKAQSPLAVLMDLTLMKFTAVVFFFHLSNSSVLPLVMQNLSLQDPQAGILLSGLCIMIAQGFMSYFAKICGEYTPIWGRKNLTLIGLFSLTVRCFLLTFLVSVQDTVKSSSEGVILKLLILSTQVLDSVGAGLFGTLHVIITNDISGGTGRFSLMLGITTGAMCIGGTLSGYIGQALAYDYGYPAAFSALGMMSLIPFTIFAVFIGETLPDYARPKPQQRRKRLLALLQRLNNQRKNIAAKFGRRRRQQKEQQQQGQFGQSSHPTAQQQVDAAIGVGGSNDGTHTEGPVTELV